MFLINWTNDASGKTFASGAGSTGFKSRNDNISHMLPMTRHRCNLKAGFWRKASEMGIAHSSRNTEKGIKRV